MNHQRSNLLFIFAALFISFCVIGCSSVPEMQIESASQAIKEMNSLEAIQYSPEPAKKAQAAWDKAEKLVEQKMYTEAKPLLLEAKTQADMANRVAKTSRELRKRESDSWQGTIDIRYQTLKTNYQNRNAIFKPDQKKEMEDIFSRIDQGLVDFKKEYEGQHYYKSAVTGAKTMAVVNEGENLLKQLADPGAAKKTKS